MTIARGRFFDSTLGAVCTLVTDGTHDTPRRVESGFPLIKAKEISGGLIDFESCDQISEAEHLRVVARSKPERGDTLFTHIGASLGEAAYVNTSRKFSIKNIALFKPNPKIIDGRYLYYLVISPLFQELAKSSRTGSAQPFLSLGHLRPHSIRFHFDIVEQRRIASILSAYDDLIENNTRRIAILNEMARRIFEEWFVRFRAPGCDAHALVESPLGPIPEGWEVVKLGGVIELNYGKALKAEQRKSGTIPVYGSSGVVGWHDEALVEGAAIIVGRKGNVGSIHWSETSSFPIDTAFYIMTKLPISFMFHTLKRMKFLNSDAAVPGLNRAQALSMEIVLPSLDHHTRFAEMVDPLYSLVHNLRRQNVNLRAQRDLLLPKLISGAIDVSEARALLEAAE